MLSLIHVFALAAIGPMYTAAQRPPALADLDRAAPARGDLSCPDVPLVEHPGHPVAYHEPVRVHPEFRARLVRFEALVADTAIEVYGRAPTTMRHYGAYGCRRVNRRGARLSEHAFGNALDVAGFFFAPTDADAPAGLNGKFEVWVEHHWKPGKKASEADRLHARFLRTLRARVEAEEGLFTQVIGPPEKFHHDHFHFDASPR